MKAFYLSYWRSGVGPTVVALLLLYPTPTFSTVLVLYLFILVVASLVAPWMWNRRAKTGVPASDLFSSWKVARHQSRQAALGISAIPLAVVAVVLFASPSPDWVLWSGGARVIALLAMALRLVDDLRGTKQAFALRPIAAPPLQEAHP